MQRITDAAERAKCALSERSEMRVHVPFVTMIDNQPFDLDVALTRDEAHRADREAGRPHHRGLRRGAQGARTSRRKDVDEVILVGGQSRFPLVHEKITRYFGKPPSKGVHPDEAVALGAALLALQPRASSRAWSLIDVLPMAIGVGLPGGRFKPVLERNTALPATKTYTLSTSRDDQTELELTIFQGDSDKVEANEYLGTLKLAGLPEAPARRRADHRHLRGEQRVAAQGDRARERDRARGQHLVQHPRHARGGEGAAQCARGDCGPEDSVQRAFARGVAAASKGGGFLGWFKRLFGGR